MLFGLPYILSILYLVYMYRVVYLNTLVLLILYFELQIFLNFQHL